MTELRRCSPEIERELHDKEARIRELEGAMDEAWGVIANASDWIPKEPGTPCERSRADWQEVAERWRDERFHPLLRATSPPDSERERATPPDDDLHEDPHHEKGDPTVRKSLHGGYVWTYCDECGPDVKVDEDGLCIACGKDAVYFGKEPDDTAEQQDVMLERREAGDVLAAYAPDSEPTEAATLSHMEEQLGWRAPQHHDTAQRQDAMLERREALERLIEEIRVNGLSDDTEDQLRQALSRTSDEGTGCVVPESIRRLPNQWRLLVDEHSAYISEVTANQRGIYERCADELDRALAQQGGQQSDASRTANIAALDHAADILDPDTPVAVRGAHSDHWKRAAARNLRDISDQMRKAAAPQPEHGESDARD